MSNVPYDQLSNRARQFYPNVLPYHNWDHALDVMANVDTIARLAVDPEVRDSRLLLGVAAAWHDADYVSDDFSQYATREERSAALAAELLPELSPEESELLRSGILDTIVTRWPKDSLFGEVLHAADTGYFSAKHKHFMGRLALMREEWGSPSWEETVERTLAFGQVVMQDYDHLMPQIMPSAVANEWLARVNTNLQLLEAHLHDGTLTDQ